MNRQRLLIPALAAALFLTHPILAAAQTHLGQPPGNLVTLRLFSGVPGGCGPDEFEFRRIHANDGDIDADAFRVPTGFALVVTDVEWSYLTASLGTQSLELFVNVSPDPLGGPAFLSTLDFNGDGSPRSGSRPMTAGFVLSEGTRLCATIIPGGGILVAALVRGYLVSTVTTSASEAQRGARMLLGQSSPNPFASTVGLDYEVPADGPVEIRIYDVAGRRVRSLVNGQQSAGRHRAVWDGKDETGGPVSPGVYFYELKIADFVGNKRMVHIR